MQMYHCAVGGSEIMGYDTERKVLKGTLLSAPFLPPEKLWVTEDLSKNHVA